MVSFVELYWRLLYFYKDPVRMKKNHQHILYVLLTLCIWSCSKESDSLSHADLMYGSWKTNYGDTIVFSLKNGVHTANFTAKVNPQQAPSVRDDHEFDYRDGRLSIGTSGSFSATYFFQLSWTEEGRSFQLSGGQWFPLYSTNLYWIVFTKIP